MVPLVNTLTYFVSALTLLRMSSPPRPFLPMLVSPAVQKPFEISHPEVSCGTSYTDHYRSQSLQHPPPVNYSLKHYERLRKECKLTHAENPQEHYSTSAMSITSPLRLESLRKAQRPEPFRLEVGHRIVTSPFKFQTTNEALMGGGGDNAAPEERAKYVTQRHEIRQAKHKRRLERAVSPFDVDSGDASRCVQTAAQSSSSHHDDRSDASAVQSPANTISRSLKSTKQSFDEHLLTSLQQATQRGDVVRQRSCPLRDETAVDHSAPGLGSNVTTTYQAVAAEIKAFWDQDVHHRSVAGRQTTVHRGSPSISLAYKSERLPEDDDLLCQPCKARRSIKESLSIQRADKKYNRLGDPSHFLTTNQLLMGNPRSQSSLF